MSGGDDRDPSKTSVKASSAAILARLLVMNTNSLGQLASDPSTSQLLQTASIPVQENILLCLVDIWVDKVGVVICFKDGVWVLHILHICILCVLGQTSFFFLSIKSAWTNFFFLSFYQDCLEKPGKQVSLLTLTNFIVA